MGQGKHPVLRDDCRLGDNFVHFYVSGRGHSTPRAHPILQIRWSAEIFLQSDATGVLSRASKERACL
jgi:hypothetical protein